MEAYMSEKYWNKHMVCSLSIFQSLKLFAENILRRYTGLFALKNGTVSERGSFDDLMAQKGYFYSLYTVSHGE